MVSYSCEYIYLPFTIEQHHKLARFYNSYDNVKDNDNYFCIRFLANE